MDKKEIRLDLTKILKPYAKDNLWVALYPNYSKVVSVGKTPLEAINMAKKKKVEKPFIIQAFSDYSGFVPSNIL